MSKLIILQGPPAAGKSTWAKNYLDSLSKEEREKTVIVSRDEIRESTGTYWVPSREDYITNIEDISMSFALVKDMTVINDATNLNPKTIDHLQAIASQHGAEVEFVPLYVPYKVALERDKKRERPVGKKVLEGFYKRYYPENLKNELTDYRIIREPEAHLDNCVICDLDATLALHQGRGPFEWNLISTDKIDVRLKYLLENMMSIGIKILFVTGRNNSARQATVDWLRQRLLFSNWELFTRDDKDFSHGDDYKEKVYHEQIEGKYNVLCVFEDSNKCVQRWRELGLLTCQVENNDY